MTIEHVFTPAARACAQYTALSGIISKAIDTAEGWTMGSKSPDVVHVFGTFDKATSEILRCYKSVQIPTLLTLCDGLGTIAHGQRDIDKRMLTHNRRHMLMQASAISVSGDEEQTAIEGAFRGIETVNITNAVVTATTTVDDTCRQYMELYTKVTEQHEEKTEKAIADTLAHAKTDGTKAMQTVLHTLLRARYLNTRGKLDDAQLAIIAQIFIHTDYDEDLLAAQLPKLRLGTFASRLLALIEAKGFITEGFMPIAPARHPLKMRTIEAHKVVETKVKTTDDKAKHDDDNQ